MKKLILPLAILALSPLTAQAETWTVDQTRQMNDAFAQMAGTKASREVEVGSVMMFHFGDKITINFSYLTEYVTMDREKTYAGLDHVANGSCDDMKPIVEMFDNVKEVELMYKYRLNDYSWEEFPYTCNF